MGAPEKPFQSPDLGTPCCETRVLILHYDDLGLTHAQNGAYRALGLPTGSVMVPGAWAGGLRGRDLGVHLTLTSEWSALKMRPLTEGESLRDEAGFFPPPWRPCGGGPGRRRWSGS